MFTTVLIANRGEIAVRVMRTLREMGIRAVAIHSHQDAQALHVLEADEAVALVGDDARSTYLDIPQVIAAARATGAEAIHPGYGFLAENAEFARACADAGIVFIGPPASAIETMGDKIAARTAVESRGVPTVPGIAEPGLDDAALIAGAERVGFPVLIKPSAGGGGKGMHRVDDPAELPDALARARREAASAFGDDTLFIERFVTNPRHIEVQVLADAHGATIHLGERECSLQRRHQKVVEEAPSALLTPEQRERIGHAAVETAKSVGYVGAGTVEFIVSADRPDEPFFMEMNTRLQVEHPVTELVTGVDLVEAQVRIAAGERLELTQDAVRMRGHAIEARIYAEDPAAGFVPTGGTVHDLAWPDGPGVRVDAAITWGSEVSSLYDPMLAKVIVHAPTRAEAIEKLDRALEATHVVGVGTNTHFLRALLAHPDVVAGDLDTGLIEREPGLAEIVVPDAAYVGAAAERWMRVHEQTAWRPLWERPTGWRIGEHRAPSWRFRGADGPVEVQIRGTVGDAEARVGDGAWMPVAVHLDDRSVEVDGVRVGVVGPDSTGERVSMRGAPATSYVWGAFGDWAIEAAPRARRGGTVAAGQPTLESPMPGAVVQITVEDGAHVEAGAAIVAVEAMKMEHVLRAPTAGTVRLHVALGAQVARGQQLASVEPDADTEDAEEAR